MEEEKKYFIDSFGKKHEITPPDVLLKQAEEFIQKSQNEVQELENALLDGYFIHAKESVEYLLKDKQSYLNMWSSVAKRLQEAIELENKEKSDEK